MATCSGVNLSKKLIPLVLLIATLSASCGGKLATPPLVYLVSDGKLVDGFQSSFCWDGGNGEAICKDTPLPHFESSTSLSAGEPIRFQLDAPLPQEVTLSISKEVLGESIISERMQASEIIDWSPTVAPGAYIVVVHAKWRQGVVSYWFSILLK